METALLTFAATTLLAFVFLIPYPRHVLRERDHRFRSLVSFAAGVSVAYVFVDLLPELDSAVEELRLASEESGVRLPDFAVHFSALLGFVLFYGMERLVRWSRERPVEGASEDEADGTVDFLLKFWGSSAYIWLVAYLIQDRYGEGGQEGLLLYFVAMAFHFLALRHSLRYEYTEFYDGGWRWLLAGACLLGWLAGTLLAVPGHVVALLLGFLGGMLIMNTTVMELPSEKEGKFTPFVVGSVVYALLLVSV